ncbi:uncharacterized protein BBOV_IV007510 [Babesia bovis T2Bo]|uniref:Uncharacterized protein n=1 Tax=Babesia bovis TaxID=5865 RepID=A7ARD8_BABBO|nr:uncharacterized protein BBOV_IV007510 [Babesia bovis T2Bo]EDO07107.1 hypothetical protein BBOV_IV007510 [Babesia bovis T2Bo]|eukprot:XP_001610675.1 hypothetical protein [Babesia bovis T2Bo]
MARLVSATEKNADKLLVYLARKIGEHKPKNVVYFIVDILCTYYPRHIPELSKIWLMDKGLDEQKQHVRNFFKKHNSTSAIAQDFINAGFDSLDSLTYLTPDVLDEIQAYNNTTWLPGHKVRVYQIFKDINKLAKAYKDELKAARLAWQYADSTIYSHGDGLYCNPTAYGPVRVKVNGAMQQQAPVEYYSNVRPTAVIGDAVYHTSTVAKPATASLENSHGILVKESPTIRTTAAMSQIANISAQFTANRVMDKLISEQDGSTVDIQSSFCCRRPALN